MCDIPEIPFPSKIVGWLNIWGERFVITNRENPAAPLTTELDLEPRKEQRYFADGLSVVPAWQPFYCILRQDLKTLTCHRSEEEAEEIPGLRQLPVFRFDEGKRQFRRRWGYETLESIKENSIQHCNQFSTERLCKSKLLDTSFNESLPDLRHTCDVTNEFNGKRRHVFKRFLYSSYEKLVGERDCRGSVPAVPSAVEEDSVIMDTSSSSRFTNFLIRKGFKNNLKRTKSATKLDRKRAASHASESDNSTFVGTLKRTMSLGRLTRKRTRSKSGDQNNARVNIDHTTPLSVINSRLKNSQSHESLLTTNSTMHSIDLTSSDVEIKPLHRSILSQDHCFQVATSHGSKYISCRTVEEREKWIESLRKTASPNQENSRRSESSLKVWVVEAKNVASKKSYFCEICLDRTLYAKTSIKTKTDMLFWGEQFEFNKLPPVEFLIVNLYREADRKKKKDRNTLIGYTRIAVADISNRQYVEKWFTTSSGTVGKGGKENKTELPLIRLKVRYQTVHILPVSRYKELSEYLSKNYVMLCDVLEPLVNIRDKEEIATTLINIMQKLNKAKDFLSEVVMTEVLRLDNQHLTFRGNSIATKAMEAHMKLVGAKYLNDTVGDFVRTIIETEDDCEVDPTRVVSPTILPMQQTNLRMYCDMVWTKIITSSSFFPSELRDVFSSFRARCEEVSKGDLSDNLISASIFLRFLCPAILSPSLFHLTQEFPPEKAARNLTLIAKTVQTLANFTKFGAKEEYMTFMNDFVEEEWSNMKDFLHKISTPGKSECFTEFDDYIDMGKEMSVLHTLLTDTLEKADEAAMEKVGALPKILSQIADDLKDPNIEQKKPVNRRSQHYDNLVNIQAHIDKTTSPTELLRDMLRHCGESADDLPMFANGQDSKNSSRAGSVDIGSGELAIKDMRCSDNYVSNSAINTQDEISNVSVSSRTVSEQHVNKSWNEIVSAAEVVNGEYIDLISFMDEDGHNSSMEMDHNVNGSQMSISQVSTVASSGYHSFGYSHSNSPIDNNHDSLHDTPKSPNNNTHTHSTPLSFSNPMYRHNHRGTSSHAKTSSPILQASSSSSLSSEEANSIKHCSPVKKDSIEQPVPRDPLRNIAPRLSSSSSTDSVQERDKSDRSVLTQSSNNVHSTSRQLSLDLQSSSPMLKKSASTNSDSGNYSGKHCNTIGSTSFRNHELSHSVDFSYMTPRHSDHLRRTATDSLISQRSQSPYSDGSGAVSPRSSMSSSMTSSMTSRGHVSPEDSSMYRRLSAQNAVHMGIRSVQRRINEQEKTKQEYESEVTVLKQQLVEAQQRLNSAEVKLQEHEHGTSRLVSDWQVRLAESEERMRKQQAEKDDQMKNIIQRLINVEDELRHEQEEMQKVVKQKQKVIEAQERRIQSLDTANNKLVVALNQLKEHYHSTTRNGLTGPLKTKLTTDITSFKTSSC